MRTKRNYERQMNDIETSTNPKTKQNLSTTYGLTKRSALLKIPGFDVTKHLSQDIMHTLLEGSVQYELRHILSYFFKERIISLSILNGAIENHPFGYSEIGEKFGSLNENVFGSTETYKIKYNASSKIISSTSALDSSTLCGN